MQRLQELQQLADLRVVEAGSDVADVAQLPVVVRGEHERAERVRTAAGTAGVAGDEELVVAVRLDLQPVARPLLLVRAVLALGDDPLEVLLARDVQQRLAVVEAVRVGDRRHPLVEHPPQTLLALDERQVDERLTVHLEQVEREVDERTAALLQLGEARLAGRVDARDLAVEHGVRRLHRLDDRLRHLREAVVETVAVARDELALAAAHVGDRAEPVELHLVDPALPAGEIRRERREHRRVGPLDDLLVVLVVALDQQPVLLLAVQMRRHERPRALEPLPVEVHLELPVALLLEQLVRPAVPDLDRAGAVLAGRDLAVELRVLERVILDVDGQRPGAGLERHALRHRPGEQHAGALEAEVVVEPAGVVPLDHEDRLLAALPPAERLGGLPGIALAAVLVEAHVEGLMFSTTTRFHPARAGRKPARRFST